MKMMKMVIIVIILIIIVIKAVAGEKTVSIVRSGPLSWQDLQPPVRVVLGGVRMICCCGDT